MCQCDKKKKKDKNNTHSNDSDFDPDRDIELSTSGTGSSTVCVITYFLNSVMDPWVLILSISNILYGFPWFYLRGKESSCQCRRRVFDSWVGKILLEKEVATHSGILAWEIPWTEEPGRLQSMELQRVICNLVTKQQQHHFVCLLCFNLKVLEEVKRRSKRHTVETKKDTQ